MKNALLIIGIFLLLALLLMPYGYYQVLKIIVFLFMLFILSQKADKKTILEPINIVLIIVAIIYNPIIPIHFTKLIWSFINIATVILLGVMYSKEYQNK